MRGYPEFDAKSETQGSGMAVGINLSIDGIPQIKPHFFPLIVFIFKTEVIGFVGYAQTFAHLEKKTIVRKTKTSLQKMKNKIQTIFSAYPKQNILTVQNYLFTL